MRRRGGGRAGQAVVLLLALLVAMAAMVFWMTDVHTLLMRKLRIQDGGDAACLAGARWQAAGLNLVGELNILRAYMVASGMPAEAEEAVYALQQRVTLTTPFLALLAAQQAARENGCAPWPEESVRAMRDYFMTIGSLAAFENFHPEAREDFLAMTRVLFDTDEPFYAMPAVAFYEASDPPSLLVTRDFYEAVLAPNWCWFLDRQDLLRGYSGPRDFGPLPRLRTEPPFGLRLSGFAASLDDLSEPFAADAQIGLEGIRTQLDALGHPGLPEPDTEEVRYRYGRRVPWMDFDRDRWTPWTLLDDLPMRADVKPCYDYQGAAAAVSVRSEDSRAVWLAAAKPFGTVGGENPVGFPLVLGGFNDVRLIPVDAAERGLTALDAEWMNHLLRHLQDFVTRGVLQDASCRYCRALRLWGEPEFRRSGLDWLLLYGHTCRLPEPDGGGGGGGSSYAH